MDFQPVVLEPYVALVACPPEPVATPSCPTRICLMS